MVPKSEFSFLPRIPRAEMSGPGGFLLPPDAGRPTCSEGADGADGPIYLDYNATTPLDPAVAAAMLPVSGLLVLRHIAHMISVPVI